MSLLLHAKGGAVATVLVLGASGALVTATVENGTTTVTMTQPSTTTGSQTTPEGTTTTSNTTTNNTVTQQILALFNRTKADEDPSGTATGKGCSDEAHARNEQMKRVDAASKTHRQDVAALGKDAAKTDANKQLVKDADKAIKNLRQLAVKAIHETFKSSDCKGNDDEDDEDDEDGSTGTTTGTTNGTTSATTTVAISGPDAKAIADAAIAEMDKVVTDLKTKLTAPTATTTTTKTDKDKDKAKSDNKSNKGKGHSEGRSHDTEDDD